MVLITIILIGIAANIDNLGISMAYGLRANKIPFYFNMTISFISMACAYLSIVVGNSLSEYLTLSIANSIGGGLLVILGVWVVMKPSGCEGKTDKLSTIQWKESIILGFILAINCLSIGFSAGITGVPPLSTSITVGLFSYLFIALGLRLGHRIGTTWFGEQAVRMGGMLLMLIGLIEMAI